MNGTIFSQTKQITIQGIVLDATSLEPLIGARVQESNNKNIYTDNYGHFTISTDRGQKILLRTFYTGMLVDSLILRPHQDTTLEILLHPKSTLLNEVVVFDKIPTRLSNNVTEISVEKLKSIPMLLGQPDVIKALSFTPGVATGTEGTSGIFVRGGTPDQNLILLDGATVYNASHLFGFQSLFDPAAIKNISFYRGCFPSRFGGRVSSVVDITMKEGNKKTHKREFNIGILNSGFLFEGPIKKEKSSYMVSGRTFYLGLVGIPSFFVKDKINNLKDGNTILNYDINAKVNTVLKNGRKLFISFYGGKDFLLNKIIADDFSRTTNINWGNNSFSLRYLSPIGNKIIAVSLINGSTYALNEVFLNIDKKNNNSSAELTRKSSINDISGKQYFSYAINKTWNSSFGLEVSRQSLLPGYLKFVEIDTFERKLEVRDTSHNIYSGSIYTDNQIGILKDKIVARIGLRLVNQKISKTWFHFIEPRLEINIKPSELLTFQLSYSEMNQPLHILSNIINGLNSDIWVPATTNIKPQHSTIYAIGSTLHARNNSWSLSVDAYSKRLTNQIDFRVGESFFTDIGSNWEDKVATNGLGYVWGLETMFAFERKKINVWISYTYSHNKRKFDNINGGEWYYHKYDRRNNFVITFNWLFSKNTKWSLSASYVYQTGYRISMPVGYAYYGAFYSDDYETLYNNYVSTNELESIVVKRNNFVLPSYQRVDASLNYKYKSKKNRDCAFSFSLYNLSGRNNAYNVRIEISQVYNYVPRRIVESLFSIIPAISYSQKL